MSVDSSEQRRSDSMKVILLVRNVHRSLAVPKLLGQSKVDDIHHWRRFPDTHDKIGGFNVTMHDGIGVDEFNPRYLSQRIKSALLPLETP